MALFEETLFGREDKVQKAIDRLKAFEPPEGYYVAFSGGKDSQCVYELCKMAGVKFDAHYSVTSVDPPELMRFIKNQYPDVEWEYHYWDDNKPEHHYPDGRPRNITMWNLIADRTIPPTRQARYCCSQLKETGGGGRVVVTGVRWAESNRRKALHGVADIQTESKKLHDEAKDNPTYKMNKNGGIVFMDDNDGARRMVEQCYAKKKTTINPIVDWEDEDVWEFLNDVAKVPHCELYDEGRTRLGCIGCPLQGRDGMLQDFERWPQYKELYIKAFDQMIKNHPGEIKVATGELVENSTEGGVQRYTQDGSLGAPDRSLNGTDQATGESGGRERERERERRGETVGTSTSGETGEKQSNGGRNEREQVWETASMVADDDGGGELLLLDQQLLTDSADTHTHTHTRGADGNLECPGTKREPQCSKHGSECTDSMAAKVLEWHLWMHRTQKDWDEPNPMGPARSILREHST